MQEPPSQLDDSSSAAGSEERLLIPVGNNRMPLCLLLYAKRRAAMGKRVEVCLLHVDEVPEHSKPSCLFTMDAPASREKIQSIFGQASSLLSAAGIPHANYLRRGSVTFSILDAAEELNCTGIVLPKMPSGWKRLFASTPLLELQLRKRGIPLVTVEADGMPVR